jgi:hypothetical protein
VAETDDEAHRQILDALGATADDLGEAVAALGVAYEQLDEQRADELEETLFRPVQRALGRAKRARSEFARIHQFPEADFGAASQPAPSTGVSGLVESAVASVQAAEDELVALQDSFLPVEFGDPALRAGISETRELIDPVRRAAREFLRTFGR